MISVDYVPTSRWHSKDRAEVASAINAQVKKRYEDDQPLTVLEVIDVVERLAALPQGYPLETNREKILHGVGNFKSMDELTGNE